MIPDAISVLRTIHHIATAFPKSGILAMRAWRASFGEPEAVRPRTISDFDLSEG
jgi:hypothetical protein